MKENVSEEEIWKDIPEYEGFYQVSSLGRVRSLDGFSCNHQNGSGFLKKGVVLSQYLNKETGYNSVGISKNNIRKTFAVHKIVFVTFHGIDSNVNMVIDHINNIKTDNRLCNLQLLTQRDNLRKSIDKSNTFSKYFGVYRGNTKDKWRSRIKIKGKNISVGQYESEEEAMIVANIAYENTHLYNGDNKKFKEAILKLTNQKQIKK